jgi:hypothetical protein
MAPPGAIHSTSTAATAVRHSQRRAAILTRPALEDGKVGGNDQRLQPGAAQTATTALPPLQTTIKLTWAPSQDALQHERGEGEDAETAATAAPAVGTPPHPRSSAMYIDLKRQHSRNVPVVAGIHAKQEQGGGEAPPQGTVPGAATPDAKRQRVATAAVAPPVYPTSTSAVSAATVSDDAVALGYELGTIKHSAFVLCHAAGPSGLTVSRIVEAASAAGMYCWGTCKTPNNSVTAALSQDPNFLRVAPSTYSLRDILRPVGQAALREVLAAKHAAAAKEAAASKKDHGGGTKNTLGKHGSASHEHRGAKHHGAAKPRSHKAGGHRSHHSHPKIIISGSRSGDSDGGAAHPTYQHRHAYVAGREGAENTHILQAHHPRAGAGLSAQPASAACLWLGSDMGAEDAPFASGLPTTADSASLYPPPSPEEAAEDCDAAARDECTSPETARGKSSLSSVAMAAAAAAVPADGMLVSPQPLGRRRVASRPPSRKPAHQLPPVLTGRGSCSAAPADMPLVQTVPTEAHARAERWRLEADALWKSSLARGSSARGSVQASDAGCNVAVGDVLPSWVMQEFMAKKLRIATGGDDDDDAATVCATLTPPQVSPLSVRGSVAAA